MRLTMADVYTSEASVRCGFKQRLILINYQGQKVGIGSCPQTGGYYFLNQEQTEDLSSRMAQTEVKPRTLKIDSIQQVFDEAQSLTRDAENRRLSDGLISHLTKLLDEGK